MLTPLPTHTPYTAYESRPSSEDCEQDLTFSEQTMSNNNLSILGGLSPPTPEPAVFHEPIPMVHCIDYSSYPHSWCEEVSASIEYDFGSTLTDILAPEMWLMSNTAITIPPVSHTSWPQSDLVFQQPQMQMEYVSYHDDIYTYSGSQPTSGGCFSSPTPDWRIFEPAGTGLRTAASSYLLTTMQSNWEDSFVCGSSSYQNF